MKAPFPYFGGKSRIAADVWKLLGDPKMYIEPFFGSGAVLLNRPATKQPTPLEIINDADGHIANVWRALQADPEAVAKVCDWPCNHADLSARKRFFCAGENDLLQKLIADPEFYDVKMAGYWIWAASHWIGRGLTRQGAIPQLARNAGVGQVSHLTSNKGIGIRAHLYNKGVGNVLPTPSPDRHVQEPYADHVYIWFRQLSERLRYVKVVCGDWSRVCGGNWQADNGPCGIFFDPPYTHEGRDNDIYNKDCGQVAHDVRDWCLARGDNPKLRIVLAGYWEEHQALLQAGWRAQKWKALGGYSKQGKKGTRGEANAHRETLFISPHCAKEFDLLTLCESAKEGTE